MARKLFKYLAEFCASRGNDMIEIVEKKEAQTVRFLLDIYRERFDKGRQKHKGKKFKVTCRAVRALSGPENNGAAE